VTAKIRKSPDWEMGFVLIFIRLPALGTDEAEKWYFEQFYVGGRNMMLFV
jgi:hypothetical protein